MASYFLLLLVKGGIVHAQLSRTFYQKLEEGFCEEDRWPRIG